MAQDDHQNEKMTRISDSSDDAFCKLHPDASKIAACMFAPARPRMWSDASDVNAALDQLLPQFHLQQANATFYRHFGLSHLPHNLTLLNLMRTSLERQAMRQLFAKGSCHFDSLVKLPDGGRCWLWNEWLAEVDSSGRILAVRGSQVDVNAYHQREQSLRQSRDRYRLLTEFSHDVIWNFKLASQKVSYVSPAVQTLLEYQPEEFMQLDILQLIAAADFERMKTQYRIWSDQMKYPERELENPYIEMQVRRRSGEWIWCEITGMLRRNDQGETELIGTARNIERRKRNEDRIVYLSYHDQLTTLYNRHFYSVELKRLDVERNLPMSLIIADVNGLKATNDIFGHGDGDKVLIAVADVLQSACRADDIVARIGGDEFVILLPQTSLAQAENLLLRLRERIEATVLERSVLSVSFGVVTKKNTNQPFSDLFKQAEDRMYKEKVIERPRFETRLFAHICDGFYEHNPTEKTHGLRVEALCRQLAEKMELTAAEVEYAGLAGRYHDIGKMVIPSSLLNRSASLNPSERILLQKHSESGYQILKTIKRYEPIAEHVLSHHERPDGQGYPRGLSGDDLTPMSQIIALANAYDTMITVQKKSKQDALAQIRRQAGTRFDQSQAETFVGMLAAPASGVIS